MDGARIHIIIVMYVNREVDAVADYVAGISYPRLRAIHWNERRINLRRYIAVNRVTGGLLYRVDGDAGRLVIRFELRRHRWVFESVRSGMFVGGKAEALTFVEHPNPSRRS